ncbi:hypothetical protein CGSSa00_11995 [Staphylococcus aureus subsp. aureus CGS00]|nr:hypothetical protein USA300HOU_0872 [Staphylococcus aureus subsp. aureus USA300_TCH1516]EFT84961.1 hypothetical protein CGSSa03_14178 [Staphylococcus aureus subsp. aureus CGS03]EFU24836.1 hypothetical protein CGSSa00_11995 [Staphylococcus aureus subsp. aureus CGS00]EFU27602.1 hypothetical protein CGSSa01_00151 [Staphylococcus aureus subsp. aureus CGS01]
MSVRPLHSRPFLNKNPNHLNTDVVLVLYQYRQSISITNFYFQNII